MGNCIINRQHFVLDYSEAAHPLLFFGGVLRIIAYLVIRHLLSSRHYQKIQGPNHKTGGCSPIIMTEGHELIEESTIGSMCDCIKKFKARRAIGCFISVFEIICLKFYKPISWRLWKMR